MEYRPATPDDAAAIAKLHADSWRVAYRGMLSDEYLNGPVFDERLAVWTQFLQEHPPRVLVVEMPDSWLVQEATTHASHDLFLAAAVAVVLTAIPALWLRDRRVS